MVINHHEAEGCGSGHPVAFPVPRPIMPVRQQTTHLAGIRTRRARRPGAVHPGRRPSGVVGTARLSRFADGRVVRRVWDSIDPRYRPAEPPRFSAGDEQSLLLRMFCHELRTPIESLRALTRALAEEPQPLGPAGRRDIAALAQEHATHLADLWQQTVSVVRSLAEPVDRPVPLRQVLPIATATAPPHRLTVRLSRNAGDRLVPAHRVRQILVNLVGNALRHGPPDGRVRVCASVRAGLLVLTVADQGRSCGPLLAALRRSAPPPGIGGLGLWIVRHLVAAEHGTITAYRSTDGIAVRVCLPAPHRRTRAANTDVD
ncbi:sensor histidine kinase [Plantactinospora endophytica]|uniref:histidine kinase n=1 Tax=Plantactinospora endophytica TaxID=673535 RepID=A0ABQ4E1X2_9ACTN|nr:HAMP domain-containing sensor histidine kinase [Plantactinospora endophytica]GIG88714.1 hypothetical protein Pen02_36500 [Plantactinospora endophytica]